jgi:hypothetical protein
MSMLLIVGFAIISYLLPSQNAYTGLSAQANETMYSTVYASFNGFALVPTLIIVGIAAGIIGLILFAFRSFAASGAAD